MSSRSHPMVPSSRDLRKRQTGAEARLWTILKDRRLHGIKFRRQHPVGPFVVDFCCSACRLVIELDGRIHEEMVEQDEERTRLLAVSGYHVIRFRNEEVFLNPDAVANQIVDLARSMIAARDSVTAGVPSPGATLTRRSPSPVRGRGNEKARTEPGVSPSPAHGRVGFNITLGGQGGSGDTGDRACAD